MVVSLYTSRVVLQTLGVEDFGIYNLVGGFVIILIFLNGPMSMTTNRFFHVEKASGIIENINRTFNVCLSIQIIISLLVIFIAETVGLWILNYTLNIPADRMLAANFVFQLSVITAVFDVLRVPYNAMIIANERMTYFAFLGIFETIAKLSIVYFLLAFPDSDKLMFYSLLLMLVNIITNIFYYRYCRINFRVETTIKRYKDTIRLMELTSFSSWMLLSQLTALGANQGLNMMMNIFNGVIINAALGIATQVNGAIYSFVGNFQMAFSPRIIQSYASGEFEISKKIVLSTSKYSFFLLVIVSLPFLIFTKSILILWIGDELPNYIESFVQIILFCSFLDALAGPFAISAQAINKIREYSIPLALFNLLTLPIAYVLLKMGCNPTIAFVLKFFISFLIQIFRYYFINKYLHFQRQQLNDYFLRVVIVFAFIILTILFRKEDQATFFQIIYSSIIIEVLFFVIILSTGLNKEERILMRYFLVNKFNHYVRC
ncbi:MATE family efflux transporter [Aquirufa sp. 5-AUSEE-100C1]